MREYSPMLGFLCFHIFTSFFPQSIYFLPCYPFYSTYYVIIYFHLILYNIAFHKVFSEIISMENLMANK